MSNLSTTPPATRSMARLGAVGGILFALGNLLHPLEHGGEQQPLLRRAEARRRTGGEDDRAYDDCTVTRSITTGCVGGPSPAPSASIAVTVSIPSVTVPTTA